MNERTGMNITLPTELHRELKAKAAREGVTLGELVEALLATGMTWMGGEKK